METNEKPTRTAVERTVVFPESGDVTKNIPVSTRGTIVIVGANGSGKSRLGAKLELLDQGSRSGYRISAQRALTMEGAIQVNDTDEARAQFLYSTTHEQTRNMRAPQAAASRHARKFGGKPTGRQSHDFLQLLNLLFSDYAVSNAEFKQQARASGRIPDQPKAALERLIDLWGTIFPRRGIQDYSRKLLAWQIDKFPPQQRRDATGTEDVHHPRSLKPLSCRV